MSHDSTLVKLPNVTFIVTKCWNILHLLLDSMYDIQCYSLSFCTWYLSPLWNDEMISSVYVHRTQYDCLKANRSAFSFPFSSFCSYTSYGAEYIYPQVEVWKITSFKLFTLLCSIREPTKHCLFWHMFSHSPCRVHWTHMPVSNIFRFMESQQQQMQPTNHLANWAHPFLVGAMVICQFRVTTCLEINMCSSLDRTSAMHHQLLGLPFRLPF